MLPFVYELMMGPIRCPETLCTSYLSIHITNLSPSNRDKMSSHNILCGIWPCYQLWWLKPCEVFRALDATQYTTLWMLVFRGVKIWQFAQQRLHQLPWATVGSPRLFNGFITQSWLATFLTMPHRTQSFCKALCHSHIECLLNAFLLKPLQIKNFAKFEL
jgi:hypothetical protein